MALARRGSDVLLREVDHLRAAVRVTKAERPFGGGAWVALPAHLLAVWRVPLG